MHSLTDACCSANVLPTSTLVVRIWDGNSLSSNTHLGEVRFPASELRTTTSWYPLSPRPGVDEKVQGQVCISIAIG